MLWGVLPVLKGDEDAAALYPSAVTENMFDESTKDYFARQDAGKCTWHKARCKAMLENREEEKELAEFIVYSHFVGHGKTRVQIMSLAEKAAREKGILKKQDLV